MNRLDLVGSTVLDTSPRFTIPPDLPLYEVKDVHMPLAQLLGGIQSTYPQSPWLASAMRMMCSVANTVNRNANSDPFWQDEVGAIHLLGPVTHHVLSAPRAYDDTAEDYHVSVVFELARLTCLMLFSALKMRFCLNSADMEPLQARFAQLLPLGSYCAAEGPIAQLKLWALITAGLLHTSDMRIKLGLVSVVETLAASEGLFSSDAILDFARSMIWIECLQEQQELGLRHEFDAIKITAQSPPEILQETVPRPI